MAMLSSMRETLQFVPAKLVRPCVFLACHMRDLQADMITRGPCGDVLQEVAQRLGSGKKLISACFCTGVVAGCREAKFPVLGSEAMLGHHCQGKLCQRLEAGYVSLGRLRQLRVVPANLSHGPLLGKPAEFGGGAYPMPTVSPSARASAAAMQCRIGACLRETTRAWLKHECNQRRQTRLSLQR